MICACCMRRAWTSQPVQSFASARPALVALNCRSFSSTQRCQAREGLSANIAQTSQPQREIPAATSTTAAQPFSERDTSSPAVTGAASSRISSARSVRTSSVPGGTPLKGLNYFKNKEDPIAMDDEEYPAWLWETLSEKKQSMAGAKQETDPRLFSKSATARRKANKRAREQAVQQSNQPARQLPVFEQSVDLAPTASARQDLTKAMREKRRNDIKEANFLKEMQ